MQGKRRQRYARQHGQYRHFNQNLGKSMFAISHWKLFILCDSFSFDARNRYVISLAKSVRDNVEESIEQVHQLLKVHFKSDKCVMIWELGHIHLVSSNNIGKCFTFFFGYRVLKLNWLKKESKNLVFLAALHKLLYIQLPIIVHIDPREDFIWTKINTSPTVFGWFSFYCHDQKTYIFIV